ncbi:hypothetical protein SAMN05444920_107390 [Nonomuraea solani]|uniref:Uncharacterized protein n=1 Tax=Nonomuraea solani TaxID=1144553 RepID=A0A1H6E2R9_9ACTN|nr:hypothetical protein [Nonomuraea solani]SEG91922.1 hypothetical protein SAMN05444920_107390 [Nonomuraea solani]
MNCGNCDLLNPPNVAICGNCGQHTQPAATETTRHLCIAMLLDPRARNSAINAILHDTFRAIAHSPGVDLATVLKYALLAQRRQRIRDATLAAITITILAVFGFSLPLLLVLSALVVFLELYYTYEVIIFPKLTRSFFDPADAPLPKSTEMCDRLNDIAKRDSGNVTVFAGYSPFIGHGGKISNWSFSMNVAKAENDAQVVPFTAGQLYDRVAAEIRALGLPGLTVEDRLFVNGLDLRDEIDADLRQAVLPREQAPPVSTVSTELIHRLRDDPRTRARPYLTVSVTGWEGEVVISIFLRFVLLAEKGLLFTEAHYSLLPPLRDAYRAADRIANRTSSRRQIWIAGQALARTFGALLFALPGTVNTLAARGRNMRLRKEAVKAIEGHTFNYGAAHNPREHATDHRYHRYFQQLDKEMYVKAAEQRIMDALTEFLVEHNVDVSALLERQTTILNNGIFVTGQGQINSDSVAAGTGAVARAEHLIGQARSAAQRGSK